MKDKIIGIIAIIALGLGVVGITKSPVATPVPVSTPQEEKAGASSGGDVFSYLRVSGAFTQGGGITATSTSGNAVPLLATDFDTENVIDVTLNVLDATLTFPATTTLTGVVPTPGMTRTIFIRNASTTAAMDLTVNGGTGVLMKYASTTPANVGVITGDTDGANYARVDLLRKANTDIEALVTMFKD